MRAIGAMIISSLGILLLLGYAVAVRASGYEFFGVGVRALSMGGAFIGKADDSSATYWNPAGLGQLKRKGFQMDFMNDTLHYFDNNSIRNVRPQEASIFRGDAFFSVHPDEPDRFSEDLPDYVAVMANYSGFYRWREYTFGAAFYVPNGNYIDWKDTIMWRDPDSNIDTVMRGDFFNRFFLSVLNISIAREVIPRLYLGAGLDTVFGNFKLDVDKSYIKPGTSLGYEYDFDSKANGTGLEGVFGILYKPTERVSLGAVYRTGARLSVEGHALTRQSAVPGISEYFAGSTDFDQDFYLPASWGVGLAIALRPNITLTVDWQGTDWTTMETDIDFHKEHFNNRRVFTDINQKLDWNIAYKYRIGIEYRFNDRWTFQGGYMYDENAIPDKASALTTVNGLIMQLMGIGMKYSWGNWAANFHFNTHWYYERVDGRPTGGQDYLAGISLARNF